LGSRRLARADCRCCAANRSDGDDLPDRGRSPRERDLGAVAGTEYNLVGLAQLLVSNASLDRPLNASCKLDRIASELDNVTRLDAHPDLPAAIAAADSRIVAAELEVEEARICWLPKLDALVEAMRLDRFDLIGLELRDRTTGDRYT
jgi:hypothetical protein